MKKRSAIYEALAISNGMVRSVRWFSSMEYILFNFRRIRTPADGIKRVNTKTIDINQSFNQTGKTME
jgi:hypothetical protein